MMGPSEVYEAYDCIHWDVEGEDCPIHVTRGHSCLKCEDYEVKYHDYSKDDAEADAGDMKYHRDVTREE